MADAADKRKETRKRAASASHSPEAEFKRKQTTAENKALVWQQQQQRNEKTKKALLTGFYKVNRQPTQTEKWKGNVSFLVRLVQSRVVL